MRVLIIEDEITAVQKLRSTLLRLDPGIQVVAELESVKDSLAWITSNPAPDLAFVDIQLSDDTSFSLFKQVNIDFPIIFTTAYDQYLLQSFENNAIDYLLKPIQEDRLKMALTKVKKLESHFLQNKFNQIFEQNNNVFKDRFKQRFLVKKGADFLTVNAKDIAYFFTAHKIIFLVDKNGAKYIIDKPLTVLEQELSKADFFRANRKYLIHIEAITKFKSNNGKIALMLSPDPQEDVMVSKENAPNFRLWIEG